MPPFRRPRVRTAARGGFTPPLLSAACVVNEPLRVLFAFLLSRTSRPPSYDQDVARGAGSSTSPLPGKPRVTAGNAISPVRPAPGEGVAPGGSGPPREGAVRQTSVFACWPGNVRVVLST